MVSADPKVYTVCAINKISIDDYRVHTATVQVLPPVCETRASEITFAIEYTEIHAYLRIEART